MAHIEGKLSAFADGGLTSGDRPQSVGHLPFSRLMTFNDRSRLQATAGYAPVPPLSFSKSCHSTSEFSGRRLRRSAEM